MIRAAGILIINTGGLALFLKRGPGGDNPGEWAFPGGRLENGETDIDAAIRETLEECGYKAKPADLKLWTRRAANRETTGAQPTPPPDNPGEIAPAPVAIIPSGDALVIPGERVDFTTFIVMGIEPFTPMLSDEHVAYAWAPPDQPPEPLHPGCRIALQRLTMDELGVARAIAAGELTSPQRYENVTLFDLRITGTGVSYRSAHDEFVYRRPEHYLTPEFLARCNGLPVIWLHPPKSILDSGEYASRVVGAMMLPYIKGSEVWGVARVYDDGAIKLMSSDQLSTSPSVVLRGVDNTKMTLEDGSTLLIEGKLALLDHLAICERGVWDKGGEPSGVGNAEIRGDAHIMTEEEQMAADKARNDAEEKEREDRARKDADADEKLDKILSCVDAVAKRMDAFEAKEKAREDADMKARKDAEEEAERSKLTKEEREKADAKRRKDAEESEAREKEAKEKKEREDSEEKRKADAEATAKKIADLEKSLPRQMTDADHHAMADAQARADGVMSMFGDRAPIPLLGETIKAYRLRIASKLQAHSAKWKTADLGKIFAADETTFGNIERDVYADAEHAAMHPADLKPLQLRGVTTVDPATGLRSTRFYGPNTFVASMKRQSARVGAWPAFSAAGKGH